MIAYFERSLTRFIVSHANGVSGGTNECFECEAERGRIRDGDGRSFLLGGAPPRRWKCRLPLPKLEEDTSALRADLQSLCRSRHGGLQLHYSSIVSHRITTGGSLEQPRRSFTAWAIAGWFCPPGHSTPFPVGWSGRGEGASWIRSKARKDLDWLLCSLERAAVFETGFVPVILSPSAAAVILHEAVGHRVEAGIRGTYPTGLTVASEEISVVDDPLAPDGAAHYEFDDENVRCLGPTTVVSKGRLIEHLHSPQTATIGGTLPTPNARAASCWDVPIPRMSNLICSSGNTCEEEMLDRLGDGIYIHRLANGINNGRFVQADIVVAERIQSGKRNGRFVTRGRVRDEINLLRRVVAVGNNPEFNSNAMCGRENQLLFNVGGCSPSIQLSALRMVA